MEGNQKKLSINCGLCEALKINEEILNAYESVEICTGVIVATEESMAMLHRHNVEINTGVVLTLPSGDTQLQQVNGNARISGASRPGHPVALLVNGKLTIEPDAREALEDYVMIQVNGAVLCPESLFGALGQLQVNGRTMTYPDGAALLDNDLTVDQVFALRAKAGVYYAPRTIVWTDAGVNAKKLAEKGVRLLTHRAFVAEKVLEDAIELFDESVNITVLPDGAAYVDDDDVILDDTLLRRYGEKLYINGNVTVLEGNADALKRLQWLSVLGDVLLSEACREDFFALKPEYKKLTLYRGRLMRGASNVTIGLAILEEGPVTVIGCAEVEIEKDVPAELILEKLRLIDCAEVICPAGLRSVVSRVGTDIAAIRESDGGPKKAREDDPNLCCVNTGVYKF